MVHILITGFTEASRYVTPLPSHHKQTWSWASLLQRQSSTRTRNTSGSLMFFRPAAISAVSPSCIHGGKECEQNLILKTANTARNSRLHGLSYHTDWDASSWPQNKLTCMHKNVRPLQAILIESWVHQSILKCSSCCPHKLSHQSPQQVCLGPSGAPAQGSYRPVILLPLQHGAVQ